MAYCGLNKYVTLSKAEYSWCVLLFHDTLSDWLQYKFSAMFGKKILTVAAPPEF